MLRGKSVNLRIVKSQLYRLTKMTPLWLALIFVGFGATPIPQQVPQFFPLSLQMLHDGLIQAQWSDSLGYRNAEGKPLIYLKLDRQFEVTGANALGRNSEPLQFRWPEELYFENVRYWVEITQIIQDDQFLTVAFQSRSPQNGEKPHFVGTLYYRRALKGWDLINRELFATED